MKSRILIAIYTTTLATKCTDTLNTGATNPARITLQQSLPVSAAAFSNGEPTFGSIDVALVAALRVTITEIEVLRLGEDDADDTNPAWTRLELTDPVELDFLALPLEGESPLVIASGELPLGSYGHVRLFVSSTGVEFASEVNVGPQTFYPATLYEVEIPSGEQTGIKTNLRFDVTEDPGDVGLVFDPEATFLNVVATGSGKVKLTPVVKGSAPPPNA